MSHVLVYRAHGDTLELVPVEASTLDEATLQTAHGVYTGLRTFPGRRAVRLAQHFERLRQSAQILGEPYALSDEWLRTGLRNAIEASGHDLVRARLTIPFGSPDVLLIALEPFTPPAPELYARGVWVGLAEGQRESPTAKNSRFIESRKAIQAGQPQDVYEIILHDSNGLISEGVSSNFYAVIGGNLRTAGEGVLEGIARSIVLDVASAVLPVSLQPIHISELSSAREAMLTSASRGVVPVVQVGETVIKHGRPGPVAALLKEKYEARIAQEAEAI
jgi:branched-chain amino acid aminotransferase